MKATARKELVVTLELSKEEARMLKEIANSKNLSIPAESGNMLRFREELIQTLEKIEEL